MRPIEHKTLVTRASILRRAVCAASAATLCGALVFSSTTLAESVAGSKGTSGDRGVNQVQNTMQFSEMERLQRMLDRVRADNFRRQSELDAVGMDRADVRDVNLIPRGTSHDQPERVMTGRPVVRHSDVAKRTSGDRGQYRITGVTRAELDTLEARLDRIEARLSALSSGYKTSGDIGRTAVRRDFPPTGGAEKRGYPSPRTSGDRGSSQVWRDQITALEQGRLARERELIGELQARLDHERDVLAYTSGGNRGTNRVWTKPKPEVAELLDRLFNHLDTDADESLTFYEAGDSGVVLGNYEALDANDDGKIARSEFVVGLPEDVRSGN